MAAREKTYALGPGVAPKRAIEEAEVRGWAPTETCVNVSTRRVIYEVDPVKRTQRAVGVVAERFAGDAAVVKPFAEALKERRQLPSRDVAVANLVSLGDVAARLRLKYASVQKWTKRYPEFPAPVVEFTIMDVYDWAEVLIWVEHKFPAYAARVAGKWRVTP